jgi:hypothetical protein
MSRFPIQGLSQPTHPTERAALQTADIARRLMRGGEPHQEEGASS